LFTDVASCCWNPPDERAQVKKPSPIATSRLVLAVEAQREVTIDDFESMVSALIFSESDVDDLCDPFTELCVDVQRRGIGRANARIARTHNFQKLFA
jgi:hypothetical protein